MKALILILCLIVVPEPISLIFYFFMKKFFPEHKTTKYLEGRINKIKEKIFSFYSKIKGLKNSFFISLTSE